jgi:UDP-N-acetylglucosamine 2-epimerase (non-hydrolysing)
MKLMTILGTRPEIIRLSRIIPKLDGLCEHALVNTGQNFDTNLNDDFFRELNIRKSDENLNCKGSTIAELIASILTGCEAVLAKRKPDRLLILGDTNSALSSIVAKRMGIPVYHMEAGNRCFDDRVPEEVNRRIIDHCSDVLMPYTERSRRNLLREGIPGESVFVTGNPIFEILNHYNDKIEASTALSRLGLTARGYFLVTMHRAENVDVAGRLKNLIAALSALSKAHAMPVVCSLHPHTRNRLKSGTFRFDRKRVRMITPPGLFDFVKLEKNAFCVLTDSGTVQEECCIFRVPNVTIRDVTERPETLESGSNMLCGNDPDMIVRCVKTVTQSGRTWTPPPEYCVSTVSDVVTKIVLGFRYDPR